MSFVNEEAGDLLMLSVNEEAGDLLKSVAFVEWSAVKGEILKNRKILAIVGKNMVESRQVQCKTNHQFGFIGSADVDSGVFKN